MPETSSDVHKMQAHLNSAKELRGLAINAAGKITRMLKVSDHLTVEDDEDVPPISHKEVVGGVATIASALGARTSMMNALKYHTVASHAKDLVKHHTDAALHFSNAADEADKEGRYEPQAKEYSKVLRDLSEHHKKIADHFEDMAKQAAKYRDHTVIGAAAQGVRKIPGTERLVQTIMRKDDSEPESKEASGAFVLGTSGAAALAGAGVSTSNAMKYHKLFATARDKAKYHNDLAEHFHQQADEAFAGSRFNTEKKQETQLAGALADHHAKIATHFAAMAKLAEEMNEHTVVGATAKGAKKVANVAGKAVNFFKNQTRIIR